MELRGVLTGPKTHVMIPAQGQSRGMLAEVPPGQIFRFGLFEADVAHNALRSGGVRVKIQNQPFRVLIVLKRMMTNAWKTARNAHPYGDSI